jgi:DNA polymerase III epsilon subunit-like protein
MEQKKLEVKQIFWKVQTIPQTKELEIGSKEFNLYKEKYREHNKLETDLEVLEDYNKSASKNPLWGKIYSLSVGFVNEANNEARIKVFKGEEKDIIQNFLNDCNDHFKSSKIIGYNLSFLLPFLRSRMLKNSIKIQGLHSGLVDLNCKPWTLQGICLQDGFKGIGWWSNSLEELAYLLNLETKFIDGKDIYSYFLAGKEEELNQSIIDETFTLINCHKIINGEEPCKNLNSTVVVLESTEEVKIPLLERLNVNKAIYTSELTELKQLLSKKKLTKKEKEVVFNLVKASLSDIDKDFGKVKNNEEIDQIINQLKQDFDSN